MIERMSKVTIGDLAREAGVSTATVDRVINGRHGVRDRTKGRVLAVARRLGYIGDIAEPALSRPGRAETFDFVLPAGANTYMDELADALAAGDGADPAIATRVHRIEGFRPEILARGLAEIGRRSAGIGVVAIDHPLVRETIRELTGAGLAVVTLASDIQTVDRFDYIGIDNRAAGRLAGFLMGRFLTGCLAEAGPAEVGLLAGSLQYRGHQEREMGFRHVLAEEFPQLTVVAVREDQDDTEHAYRETGALLRDYPGLRGVYNAGAGNRGLSRALEESGRARDVVAIGHELTPFTRKSLISGTMDAVIDQDARAEAVAAIRALALATSGTTERPRTAPMPITAYFRENLPQA
jgi:LacI family transcriptional regulator